MSHIRNLGNGYALALKTGGTPETHITLVYFNNCKRGYEQNMVNTMAGKYFADNDITKIKLELGELCYIRSVEIRGEIVKIIDDLHELFKNFDTRERWTPHIDLRGNRLLDIDYIVSTTDNWLYN